MDEIHSSINEKTKGIRNIDILAININFNY
jgi:hypothetical protein